MATKIHDDDDDDDDDDGDDDDENCSVRCWWICPAFFFTKNTREIVSRKPSRRAAFSCHWTQRLGPEGMSWASMSGCFREALFGPGDGWGRCFPLNWRDLFVNFTNFLHQRNYRSIRSLCQSPRYHISNFWLPVFWMFHPSPDDYCICLIFTGLLKTTSQASLVLDSVGFWFSSNPLAECIVWTSGQYSDPQNDRNTISRMWIWWYSYSPQSFQVSQFCIHFQFLLFGVFPYYKRMWSG